MSSTKKTKPGYQVLTPKSETGRRFTHWYSHGWDFIEKTTPTKWTGIDFYPLSPREIWNRHQNRATIIGLRFGPTTRFLTLDIDRPSPYHPANDRAAIRKIKAALEEIGLCRYVLIQSSASGGIHLIFPLPAEVPTFKAACLFKAALESAGLEIAKGKLETFPNPKRYSQNGKASLYNGIRLPLQPGSGSYLLDDDLNIVSERVEDFLDQMDWAAAGQDLKTFTARLDPTYEKYKARPRWPENSLSDRATKWKDFLETLVAEGWTGYGQTNYLLGKFVAHTIVFSGLQGRELREQVKERVINAPGYQQYCRHQHEIERRIDEVCYYTERNNYYLPYCNHPERDSTFEETYNRVERPAEKTTGRQFDTLNRLIETVAYLEARGELPTGISARRNLIQKIARELHGKAFSIGTLSHRDYLPYWHPKYRDETGRVTRENEENPEPPVSPLETPEPLPDGELYRSGADPDPSADSPAPSLPFTLSVKTPEPLPDQGLYPSEGQPPEIIEPEPPQTLAGQEFVSIAPLYEVFVCDLTDRPETESSVSENPVSPLPVLIDRSNPEEKLSPDLEQPSPRKRKLQWEKLTLLQRLEKWKARKIPLVYTGAYASGFVDTRESKRSLVYSIAPEATVLISDLNHSSVWFHPEDEDNLQIYVKPIDRGKEWKNGIAVLAKHLQPLDS